MLFGNREIFAIEAMSESGLQPPSAVWGRMRVWCEGESIGDYAEPCCALFPAFCGFKYLERVLPKLWHPVLDGLDDTQLWNHFDGLLYGYHGDLLLQDDRPFEQCLIDSETWGGYNFLTNWGEQFDAGGKSFIVCRPDGFVSVLNRSLSPGKGISCRAPLEETLAAIRRFIDWFYDESERLGVPAHAQ